MAQDLLSSYEKAFEKEWNEKLSDLRKGIITDFLRWLESDAAQQSVQADGAVCNCNPNEAPYKVGTNICAVCELPRR